MESNAEGGARLRQLINERMAKEGIRSYAELARKSGIGRDTIQVWLRGDRRPTPEPGHRVAKRLGVTYSDLLRALDGEDKEDPEPQQLIAAFEWAIERVRFEWSIERVRAGQVPPHVRAQVEAAVSRSGARPRPRAERPITPRKES